MSGVVVAEPLGAGKGHADEVDMDKRQVDLAVDLTGVAVSSLTTPCNNSLRCAAGWTRSFGEH